MKDCKRLLATLLLIISPAALTAGAIKPEILIPAAIPHDKPSQAELTDGLRKKTSTLGLNGLDLQRQKVSRALLLLPVNRAKLGVINFEIEKGGKAGVYQCEALGRGLTSTKAENGWQKGIIDGQTIYYAPDKISNGATIAGIYDLRNISPDQYEIALLGKPGKPDREAVVIAATTGPKSINRPYWSAVWRHWYPVAGLMPVDMIWAADSQTGSQGEKVPYFEQRPAPTDPDAKQRQALQLTHEPKYYYGPYGRSGFAVHTDSWEDPEKQSDPAYAGRKELRDFRYRSTNGCVKLRQACLSLFNEFIDEQEKMARRVQLEIRTTDLLDKLP